MRRAHVRFFGVCLVLVVAATAASAQSRTRTVATSGGAAPGGGTFAPTIERAIQKGLPSIDGSTIVFGTDVLLNGQTVSNFGINSQPGNNQTLVFKRFGQGNLAGLISSLEFGNYLNQHHPEEASVGWKFGAFKVDMTPKPN